MATITQRKRLQRSFFLRSSQIFDLNVSFFLQPVDGASVSVSGILWNVSRTSSPGVSPVVKLGGENVCRVSDYSLFCRVVKRSRTGLVLSAFFTLSSNRLFFKVCK